MVALPASLDLEAMHARYAECRDTALRDQLIEAHAALAHSLVSRFLHRGEATDDLQQVAMLALLHAVERFDPGRGLQFSTFATPTVLGELKRHFRDRAWAIRLPRRVHDRYLAVQRVRDDLSQELQRSPTVPELAARAGLSEEDVLESVEAADARGLASLDMPRPGGNDGDMFSTLGVDDDGLRDVDQRATLEQLLSRLAPEDRDVIRMRFYEGMTQHQIADALGTNQMHVSRTLTRSLRRLRALASS